MKIQEHSDPSVLKIFQQRTDNGKYKPIGTYKANWEAKYKLILLTGNIARIKPVVESSTPINRITKYTDGTVIKNSPLSDVYNNQFVVPLNSLVVVNSSGGGRKSRSRKSKGSKRRSGFRKRNGSKRRTSRRKLLRKSSRRKSSSGN